MSSAISAAAPLPFAETKPGASFIFAFRALPLVLVISALATLLFYWGVLQRIVQGFAWVLRRSVGIGGPLGLGAAVHIFVGHIEAPLLIRPYLARLERGELFALMSCGMAGIAGTVMVLYAAILGPVIPDALGNILIAAVISTPAALAIAALMVPFRPDPSPTRRAGDRRSAGQRDGRDRQGHARRHRLSRQHHRDAGRAGGARQPRQQRARPVARPGAASRSPCSASSPTPSGR